MQSEILQKNIAEHALGAIKGKENRAVFLNFLLSITADCDCFNVKNMPRIVKDIGIMASNDPVALDQASYDLVNKAAGLEDAFKHEAGISGLPCLEYSQKIGLGTRKYKLTEITAAK